MRELTQSEPQVDAGADVNFLDHFGQTVLVWAAYTGTPVRTPGTRNPGIPRVGNL